MSCQINQWDKELRITQREIAATKSHFDRILFLLCQLRLLIDTLVTAKATTVTQLMSMVAERDHAGVDKHEKLMRLRQARGINEQLVNYRNSTRRLAVVVHQKQVRACIRKGRVRGDASGSDRLVVSRPSAIRCMHDTYVCMYSMRARACA